MRTQVIQQVNAQHARGSSPRALAGGQGSDTSMTHTDKSVEAAARYRASALGVALLAVVVVVFVVFVASSESSGRATAETTEKQTTKDTTRTAKTTTRTTTKQNCLVSFCGTGRDSPMIRSIKKTC